MTADENAIRTLLRAREVAVEAGDAEKVISFLAEEVVQYDLAPPLRLVGSEARDQAALQAWFDTWAGGVRTHLSDVTVVVDGDLAAAWGLLHLNGTSKDTGKVVSEWSRSTVVLAKANGEWRIVHDHSSYPLRMDGTGLAAVDLVP
jgi:ketosteroid isomerase-like protein